MPRIARTRRSTRRNNNKDNDSAQTIEGPVATLLPTGTDLRKYDEQTQANFKQRKNTLESDPVVKHAMDLIAQAQSDAITHHCHSTKYRGKDPDKPSVPALTLTSCTVHWGRDGSTIRPGRFHKLDVMKLRYELRREAGTGWPESQWYFAYRAGDYAYGVQGIRDDSRESELNARRGGDTRSAQ